MRRAQNPVGCLVIPSAGETAPSCHSERSEDRFLFARVLREESWLAFNPIESHETAAAFTSAPVFLEG